MNMVGTSCGSHLFEDFVDYSLLVLICISFDWNSKWGICKAIYHQGTDNQIPLSFSTQAAREQLHTGARVRRGYITALTNIVIMGEKLKSLL